MAILFESVLQIPAHYRLKIRLCDKASSGIGDNHSTDIRLRISIANNIHKNNDNKVPLC